MPRSHPHPNYYRYIFLILFGLFAYLSFRVIDPLLDSIIMGAVMAYLFYPLYARLNSRINIPALSAMIICVLIAVLSIVAIVVAGRALADDAKTIYLTTKQALTAQTLFGECTDQAEIVCQVMMSVKGWIADPQFRQFIDEGAHKVGMAVFERTSAVIYSLPDLAMFIFISFFVSFYLFIDGKKLLERIKKSLPIRRECQETIIGRVASITRATVQGSLLLAVIQGIFGAIGFLVLGVPQPMLWGIMMAVFSLVPYIGTAIVWVPASIWLIAVGMPVRGFILLAYGALVIALLDNALKSHVIGKSAQVHPLLILIGVFGGISAMGLKGFLVGPIILSVFEALLEIYETEKGEIV